MPVKNKKAGKLQRNYTGFETRMCRSSPEFLLEEILIDSLYLYVIVHHYSENKDLKEWT